MYATPAYTASKHAVTALTRTFGVRAHNKTWNRNHTSKNRIRVFLTGSYPVFEMRLDPDPGKTHSDYLIFFL